MDLFEWLVYGTVLLIFIGIIYISNLIREIKVVCNDTNLACRELITRSIIPLIEHKKEPDRIKEIRDKRAALASARMKEFWKKVKEDQK